MDDAVLRDECLPAALAKVQQWMNYNHAAAAAGFAARYADHPAVSDQWLVWIAQNWGGLAPEHRDRAVRASGRNELHASYGAAQLTPFLLDHVVGSDDLAVWASAPRLWAALNDDQRARLLAAEGGHCPELSQCAAEAPAEVLWAALQQAGANLTQTLDLLHDAPGTPAAIESFVKELIGATSWQGDTAQKAVSASNDATPLWPMAIEAASHGREALGRAADMIRTLATAHPQTVPSTFAADFAPLVHRCADDSSAQALGRAVEPLPAQARAIAKTLTGANNTVGEQRRRNAAFKKAAGVNR
ncbi:hypothetical protein [Kitasatospora sp. CMC57]